MNKKIATHPALKGVFVLSIPAHMDIALLDEEMMRNVGWVREKNEDS